MLIRYGYDFTLRCAQPTPMIAMVSARAEQDGRQVGGESHQTWPVLPVETFLDMQGNRCRRFVAPAGEVRLTGSGLLRTDGKPHPVVGDAAEVPVAALPPEVLPFLAGSRYCETDLLSTFAWGQFGHLAPGWGRVQAIMDWCHGHIRFNYQAARSTRTAYDAFREGTGVCRDFAHLGVTLCRCLNIPARYVNGHLGDIGVPVSADPMDFAAWIEVYLGGAWHTFDPRNNIPRIGRIVLARGRDAAEVPMIQSFGPHELVRFQVVTDEVPEGV